MEGQLSEHPLAELIREISDKRLSGRLRAQQERVTVVVYFKSGSLNYAASNARMLRLREHLLKQQIVSEEVMGRFDAKASDISLAKQLTAEGLVSERQAALLQFQQVTDVLRLALLWIEGRWEFDSRSQLSEEVPFELEVEPLLLDACRRIPLQFVASRFTNNAEIVSPVVNPPQRNDLQPTEVFLLSRLDGPMSISDLGALSGLPEAETLRLIYALSLTGLIQRQHLRKAFRGDAQPAPPPLVAETPKPAADVHSQTNETEALLKFLDRIDRSSTHYEVLDVGPTATGADIKKSYYEIARRYHPDRFRKDSDPDLNFRIESAFARVTQAYDTLRDAGLRATYESKLDAQARARTMVETPAASPSAPPPPTGQPAASSTNKSSNAPLTDADRAAAHFQEALAAKQLGKSNSAIGLFSAAARLVPNDPRYRAYYGQALASHPGTRRLAEAEIQAAVKIDPENADYRVMLAELYRDLGFNVRARSELERILKSAPNHQRARELLRAL